MAATPPEGPVPLRRALARWEEAASLWFYASVAGLVALWLFLLPFDATDLCYLLSLEDHAWVAQEVVHPLWVPLLWVIRGVLRALGLRGMILVPIEAMNVLLTAGTLLLFFRLARRLTKDALSSAAAVLLLAASAGFNTAGMRPTPYAPAFLCVAGSLLLLVGERRASPLRHLAAGAIAGVAMALHASAMALAPAALLCALLDPDRGSVRSVAIRVAAYGAGMAGVAGACWTAWTLFNGLDASFFRPAHLRSLFSGVEQVPLTSIYSSGSWASQVSGLWDSLIREGGRLLLPAIPAVVVEARRALRRDPPAPPEERRLIVAALALFGGIAGFFFINNDKNGFIYASMALLPLVIARAASRWPAARRGLGLSPILAVPLAVSAALSGTHRFNDPLPQELRFVESALGPRSVVLVPGCAFAEIRLLSPIQVFMVEKEATSAGECAIPRALIGDVLRARVRAWQGRGLRVFYALGDEDHDFSGDANGREKEVQIFWSPELRAKDRAPRLRAAREALAAAGLRLGDPIVSPHGARYAEVKVDGAGAEPPPWVTSREIDPVIARDVSARVARTVVGRFHDVVPGDPWAPCDEICLEIARPSASCAVPITTMRSQCACPLVPGSGDHVDRPWGNTCHFGPSFDGAAAEAYIVPWARRVGLGKPRDFGVSFRDDVAEVRIDLTGGTLRMRWKLTGSCGAGPVEVRGEGLPASALPSAEAAHDFAAGLPAPLVRG